MDEQKKSLSSIWSIFLVLSFSLIFIFPKYWIYLLISTLVVALFLILFGQRYFNRFDNNQIYYFIGLFSFFFGYYVIYLHHALLGLFIWIFGFSVAFKGIKLEKTELDAHIQAHNRYLNPILLFSSFFVFILTVIVGLDESRIDAPIIGFIFLLISIVIVLFNARKSTK